jgi:squalene synthase HpnC
VVTAGEAYGVCERIARRHYENFPVASFLLPAAMRPHIAAIYAFARTADDFADEGDLPAADRLALLDEWERRLTACLGSGTAGGPNPESRIPSPGSPAPCPMPLVPEADAIFLALSRTIGTLSLPAGLFEDLLSAFRQDVVTTRYETWADVMDYCRRSANPVGRLVLRAAGRADARLDAASDAVCTALQLTNFWQDLERDWRKGRLYVPREDRERFGAPEGDLDARSMSPAWRAVMFEMAERTRALFDEGRAVADGLEGRLRYELRLTWLGGVRVLERLERSGFDVFTSRPQLGPADVPALVWNTVSWSRPRAA